MSREQLLYTTRVFDAYEKRFAEARQQKPLRDPTDPATREEIRREARQMLCLDVIPTPTIKVLQSRDEEYEGVTVRILQFRSWEHCYGEASLFLPKERSEKSPAVVICNGHSNVGRFCEGYQRVALRLASHGFIVFMNDNVGQGSRDRFGHWNAVGPLCGGITLQGMIVAETNAWIDWLAEQPFVDADRIGACGNSGGGTLTLFLAATNPRLAAISSTGYPSEFAYILQKEKKHCCCNLLRGCAQLADMAEIYATFAPKPLLIGGGKWDNLIPPDLLRRTIRKVRAAYGSVGAADAFEGELTETKHSWEVADFALISDFFCRRFGMEGEAGVADTLPVLASGCRFTYPDDAMTTDELAAQLVGHAIDPSMTLADVYSPVLDGAPVDSSLLSDELLPADPMQILAQMECALTK